jgi:hypothetical protein
LVLSSIAQSELCRESSRLQSQDWNPLRPDSRLSLPRILVLRLSMHASYVGAAFKSVHCEFSLRAPSLISITSTFFHNSTAFWAFAVLLIRRQKNIANKTSSIFSFFFAISRPLSLSQRSLMSGAPGSHQIPAKPLKGHTLKGLSVRSPNELACCSDAIKRESQLKVKMTISVRMRK